MKLLVHVLLPMVISYVRHYESVILKIGEPLIPDQMLDARKIGIQQSQQVRVMRVDRMLWPEEKILQRVAKWAGLMVGS